MDSPRILIVDDQVDALQGVSRILKNAGYETFEAINGADCLKMAAEHKPDLILLDVVCRTLTVGRFAKVSRPILRQRTSMRFSFPAFGSNQTVRLRVWSKGRMVT